MESATLQLAVYDTGPADITPVLLAHGMSWDHRQFDEAAGALVRRGHRVVSYDARGTGASTRPLPLPIDHSLTRHVQDCQAVVASLGDRPPVIGGVSMGAAVTLEVARAATPGSIAGVVQVAPGVGPDGPAPETVSYLRWIAGALGAGGWEGLVDVIRSSDQAAADIDEQVGFALQWQQRFDAGTLVALFEGFCTSAAIPHEPAVSPTVPAVVIAWPGDALHPLSFARHAVEVLGAGTELVCVDPPASGDLPVPPVVAAVEGVLARVR